MFKNDEPPICNSQEGENGLFYIIHSDHLGSNTALRKPNGSRVATYYLPFGNYRGAAPNQTITDRDFTGQPENREVGLLYYQARFYVPGIGRFASADTIVPDPANPQQYNRYSYVLNNALRYTDPTGHSCYNPTSGSPCTLSDGTGNNEDVPSSATTPSMPTSFTSSLIDFIGGDWTDAEMRAAHQGAYMLALALARAMNDLAGGAYDTIGWEVAFFAVFGGQVTFNKTGGACGGDGCWGRHVGDNTIDVYTDATNIAGLIRGSNRITSGELWAVHELGHNFEGILGGGRARTALGRSNVPDGQGFAGTFPGWRQSPSNTFGEQFADSVIGWTYNRWAVDNDGQITGAGQARQAFMQQQMSLWVSEMTGVGVCGGGCR